MAIRNRKWEKHPKKMRGLLAEKAGVAARKARKAAREKPHSGAKAAALKLKGQRVRKGRMKIPKVRA